MSIRSFAKFQRGVSLIEILITTLILGVGLLGVAALQVSSLSSNQEGFFTSQATSIADEFASRIRSAKMITSLPDPLLYKTDDWGNPRMVQAGYVANYNTVGVLTCDAPLPADSICRGDGVNAAVNCNQAQMAFYDKWETCKAADDTLPQGKVRIASNGGRLTVSVDWDSASARKDIGNLKNLNQQCEAITGSAERNCIIVEINP